MPQKRPGEHHSICTRRRCLYIVHQSDYGISDITYSNFRRSSNLPHGGVSVTTSPALPFSCLSRRFIGDDFNGDQGHLWRKLLNYFSFSLFILNFLIMIITIIRLSFSFLVRWYKNSKKNLLSLWFIIWNVDVDALVKSRVSKIVFNS